MAAPRSHPGSLVWWNANDGESQVSARRAGGSEEVKRPPRSLPQTLSSVIIWE